MTVLFVIVGIAWLAIMVMVCGLCVSAARGDAVAASYVQRGRRRRGRFGRGSQVRMLPRTRVR